MRSFKFLLTNITILVEKKETRSDEPAADSSWLSGIPPRLPEDFMGDPHWQSIARQINRLWAFGEWIEVNHKNIETKEQILREIDAEIASCKIRNERKKLLLQKTEILESLSKDLKERHLVNIGPLPTLGLLTKESFSPLDIHPNLLLAYGYSGGSYGGPNWSEIWTSIWNPYDAYYANKKANLAFEETKKKYGKQGHNDESDAFRHAMWNCHMARQIGASEAKKFADAHEENASQPEGEKKMDLHNNQAGRDLVTDPKSVLGDPPAGKDWGKTSCKDLVDEAIRQGKLKTSPD